MTIHILSLKRLTAKLRVTSILGVLSVIFLFATAFRLPGSSHRLDSVRRAHHSQQTLQVIHGSETPELIPDVLAYRLFLDANVQPENPTPADLAKQHARLARIGLAGVEETLLNEEISKFHNAHVSLAVAYKQAFDQSRATGGIVDGVGFNARREALVLGTQQELKSILSTDGFSHLDKFIQGQKARMTIVKSQNMP